MGNLKLKCKSCGRYLEAHSSYNTFNHSKRRPEVTIVVNPCKTCIKKAKEDTYQVAIEKVKEASHG